MDISIDFDTLISFFVTESKAGKQGFSPFFDPRNPSLGIEQFGGSLGYNLLANRRQVQKLGAPVQTFHGNPVENHWSRERQTHPKVK